MHWTTPLVPASRCNVVWRKCKFPLGQGHILDIRDNQLVLPWVKGLLMKIFTTSSCSSRGARCFCLAGKRSNVCICLAMVLLPSFQRKVCCWNFFTTLSCLSQNLSRKPFAEKKEALALGLKFAVSSKQILWDHCCNRSHSQPTQYWNSTTTQTQGEFHPKCSQAL